MFSPLRSPTVPADLPASRVLTRFGLRTAILVMFASFGGAGFSHGLGTLLWMTVVLCIVIATLKREPVFSAGLNHWDEAVAYTALYCAIINLDHLAT